MSLVRWSNVNKSGITAPVSIKATPGTIGAIHIDNSSGAAAVYVQLLDSPTGTLGSNIIDSIYVAVGDTWGMVYPVPGLFTLNGIAVGSATTYSGSTTGTAVNITVTYR